MKNTKSASTSKSAKRAKRVTVAQRMETSLAVYRAGVELETTRKIRHAVGAPYVTGCDEYKALIHFMEACRKFK